MTRTELERLILSLSKAHLKATMEEAWDRWEAIADERDRLYRERPTNETAAPFLDKTVARQLEEIDRAISAIMQEKKGGVLAELDRVRRARQAMAGYKAGQGRGGRQKGLKITC